MEDQYEAAPQEAAKLAAYWRTEIHFAQKREEKWRKAAAQVIKTYKGDMKTDEDDKLRGAPSFNILYSNTETLKPALYSKTPTPDIRQRWADIPNPVHKEAARVLERAIAYFMDTQDFDGIMAAAVSDYVLPGRAVTRVKYEPEVEETEEGDVIKSQEVCWESVHWKDFLHGPGRNWDEIGWTAFRQIYDRDELDRKFGARAKGMKLDYTPEGVDGEKEENDALKRATVWEIHDKSKNEILFVAIDSNLRLLKQEKGNPLRFDDFWCVPRPMLSIETTDDLVPEPEYLQYESLASELEEVTKRIQALVKGIKARGGYNGVLKDDLANILQAGENDLVPLDNAVALSASGAKLGDNIWMWPIGEQVAVVENLYKRRADIIQSIYELTGISDIVRGSSDPNETATAQSIKAQFGSQRLNRRQREVQRYARDLIRLGCEVIGSQFTPETLSAMTGLQVGPEIMAILRSDLTMSFVIDIETDSTISEDILMAQQRAGEFAQGMGTFLQAVMPLVQTGALPQPAAVEMVKSYAQKFKMGKGVEDAIDQMGAQPPQQGPSKEQIDAEVKKQELALKDKEITGKLTLESERVNIEKQKLGLDAYSMQLANQRDDARFNMEAQGMQHQQNMDGQRFAFERENADRSHELEGKRFAYTQRSGELARRDANMGNPDFAPDMLEEDMKNMEAILQAFQASQVEQTQQFMAGIQAMMQQIAQGQQMLAQAISAPKRIVYENGRPVGSEPVTMQ